MTTIEDVAARAGVARGTVSNVLNHPELVAEATTAKVRAAIAELGYVPSNSARIMGGARPRTIGLLVHDVGNPFFAAMAIGVEDIAAAAGYVIMLSSTRADETNQRRAVEAVVAQDIPGVLISPTSRSEQDISFLREHGRAVVLLDHHSTAEGCSTSVDDAYGGSLATTHLLDQGRVRLCFVGAPRRTQQHAARYQAMRRTIKAAGHGRDALRLVHTAADTIAAGFDAASTLLSDPRPLPDGIFCGNDLLAIGVMQALRAAEVGVPDRVAVMGYDDIDLAAMLPTPLTSVRQPMYELGRAATEMLLSELGDPQHVHSQRTFLPELRIRATTV